jgi:hypothetical protein
VAAHGWVRAARAAHALSRNRLGAAGSRSRGDLLLIAPNCVAMIRQASAGDTRHGLQVATMCAQSNLADATRGLTRASGVCKLAKGGT